MLELEEFYHECTCKYFAVDIYGAGPEEDEIKRAFHGRKRCNKGAPIEEESHLDSDLEELQSLSREYIAKKIKSIKMKLKSQDVMVPKTMYEWRRRPIPAKFMGPVDHALL